MESCAHSIRAERFYQIRYIALLFFIVLVLSYTLTVRTLIRWERSFSVGKKSFSGVVVDAGIGTPGNLEKGRWQTVRLNDGIPALMWMKVAARLGDKVEGVATFRVGEGMRNPGGFSSRSWLWSKGVAFSASPTVCKITSIDSFLLKLRRIPDQWRDKVRASFTSFWESSEGGALLASLTLGDSSQLSELDKYHLRFSGLSHLTSVSGTHLYFFLSPFYFISNNRHWSNRSKKIILIILMMIPGVLCGWKSGIARASLTILALQMDTLFRKRRDPVNVLFFVATCLMLMDPFCVWGQSFWMSLSAAGAISFTSYFVRYHIKSPKENLVKRDVETIERLQLKEKISNYLPRLKQYLKRMLIFTTAAQLSIFPYTLMTSAGLQILSPLLNLVAIPLASVLTAISYLVILILSLFPHGHLLADRLGAVFSTVLNPGATILMWLSRQAASIKGAFVSMRNVSLFVLFICICFLAINRKKSFTKARQFAAVALSVLLISATVYFSCKSQPWRVFFLDVDQGDATLIVSPNGRTCLIDGGDRGHGFKTIIPVIRMYSLHAIDLAIVTHAHSDHASGILELLECGMIDRICMPVEPSQNARVKHDKAWESDLTEMIKDTSNRYSIPCSPLKCGDQLDIGDIRIDILNPEKNRNNRDLNDDSLVLRMTLGDITILFTGDLTKEGERSLIEKQRDLSADILHVPHHGSKSSSTKAFLEAVSPRVSVLSVGRDNRFSHPHASVLDRLNDIETEIFRTDLSGAIFLIIREGKGTITEWVTP